MNKAWIKFDPTSLDIKEVTWTKPASDYLEIEFNFACDLLSGNSSLLDYCINQDDSGKFQLSKIEYKIELPKFWNLMSLSEWPLPYNLDTNKLEIALAKQKTSILLFCTTKDQPWWLIKSYVIDSKQHKIVLNVKDANKYSWFIGGT